MAAEKDVLVDVVAATAGVLAAWFVADLVVALAERRRPMLLEPSKLPEHFTNNHRMAGVFHLGQAEYDVMHLSYHSDKARTHKKQPDKVLYYGLQALVSVVRLGYHIAWAYRRHFSDYQKERRA